MDGTMILAPAKVNLFLHVGPPRADGRHPLDSLVVFAGPEAADQLILSTAETFELQVSGRTAEAAGSTADNLVTRAAMALQAASGKPITITARLDKRLPVAAGIGGGSADAGAILRALADQSGLDECSLLEIAATLGGDVPAAMLNRPCQMRGDGDRVSVVDGLPALNAVLVNCGAPCPTGPVFRLYDEHVGLGPLVEIDPPIGLHASDLMNWLGAETRNDLEAPATALVPEIGETLDALRELDGARLVRMSGSGATCFALFESGENAQAAALALEQTRPSWWVRATKLGTGA
ncbi:MAG: 4-(cytidine 5'-diphospho)-2-C-methyl-D-erythritol kinase [Pseudomonadota bacterium]